MPFIVIPYTRYRFRPPAAISKVEFETFKSRSLEDLRRDLAATAEQERNEFVRKHPKEHLCTKLAFYILLGSAACGVLLLGFFVITQREISSILWQPVVAAFALSSVLVALVFRSYVETYSSFKNFLAARNKFYGQLKRDVDKAACFDNFVYRLYASYALDDAPSFWGVK